ISIVRRNGYNVFHFHSNNTAARAPITRPRRERRGHGDLLVWSQGRSELTFRPSRRRGVLLPPAPRVLAIKGHRPIRERFSRRIDKGSKRLHGASVLNERGRRFAAEPRGPAPIADQRLGLAPELSKLCIHLVARTSRLTCIEMSPDPANPAAVEGVGTGRVQVVPVGLPREHRLQ